MHRIRSASFFNSANNAGAASARADVARLFAQGLVAAMLLGGVAGCGNKTAKPSSASASATGSTTAVGSATGAPSSAKASASQKPPPLVKLPPAYTGPTGFVTGVISASGDEPPLTNFTYPKGCEAASAMYGKVWRVGQDGGLADAIVSVTNYEGFVPAKAKKVDLSIKTCTYNTRAVAITDNQHIEVRNLDPMRGYIPHLDGARSPATIVAVPRGAPVKLYSRGRQRYWLRDQMGKPFMLAHVWHFPYSTTAVTELDGRYRIAGIPVGAAQLNVMIPLEEKGIKTLSKKIDIKKGENKLDLTMIFDLAKDLPSRRAPKGSAASSATPSAASSATPSAAKPGAPPAGSAKP